MQGNGHSHSSNLHQVETSSSACRLSVLKRTAINVAHGTVLHSDMCAGAPRTAKVGNCIPLAQIRAAPAEQHLQEPANLSGNQLPISLRSKTRSVERPEVQGARTKVKSTFGVKREDSAGAAASALTGARTLSCHLAHVCLQAIHSPSEGGAAGWSKLVSRRVYHTWKLKQLGHGDRCQALDLEKKLVSSSATYVRNQVLHVIKLHNAAFVIE